MSDSTSVFACDPQPIVVEGLRHVLAGDTGFHFAGSADKLDEALEKVRAACPDLVLIDNSYGLKPSCQLIADMKTGAPNSRAVLWVVDCSETDCLRALQTGARGVLSKILPVETLLECLRTVRSGQIWVERTLVGKVFAELDRNSAPRITRRERDIIDCVSRGLTNREVAAELGITPGTVKVHLMHIFEKTGVKDRFELAIRNRRPDVRRSPAAGNLGRGPGDIRRRD